MEGIEKLPRKWQDYITQLERERDHWKAEAQRGSVADSNVLLDRSFGAGTEWFGLPKNERIRFIMSGNFGRAKFIEVRHGHPHRMDKDGRFLHVYASEGLVIHPSVTNVLALEVPDRDRTAYGDHESRVRVQD
jgi:hypothetical protein